MRRALAVPILPSLLLVALLAPSALAHGLASAGGLVPLGVPPAVGKAPGTVADPWAEVFSAEAGVSLLRVPRSSHSSWASEPTTEYDLRFVCPDVAESAPTVPGVPVGEAPTACPAYVLDVEDMLAQPDLAVDPRDPSLVAFHALHGGPGLRTALQAPAPTEASRDNQVHQPHTTFQSRDGGAFWDDNRYYAPTALSDANAEVFGEDNAIALDRSGKATLASLYSHRAEAGGPVGYTVYLWSSDRISSRVEYEKANVAREVPAGLVADSLDLVWHPGAGRMVALWRVTGPDGPRVHVEHQDGQWTSWDDATWQPRVGACDALSNAIGLGDRVVFACAQGAETRVWALEPDLDVTDLGVAPLRGMTSLRLADAGSLRDGGAVLAGAAVREGRSIVTVAWGVPGEDWGRPTEHGSSLTDLDNRAGADLVEARVTALAVLGTSGTAHFLVQERFSGGQGLDGRIFGKTYGVVQSTGRFLGTFGIGYGDPQSRATVPATVSGSGLGGYADAHDGMVVVPGPLGDDRLFIAFGDYGYVRFAEVVEVEPTVPVFPPIAAPAALPTLSAATSPVLVAAAAGVLSMAAVSRIVLARSKKSVEVQA